MVSGRAHNLCEILEEDIATGKIAPGSKLDEVSLSERFGVSRTPVREALIQLAAVGLVDIKPHRGAYVTPIYLEKLLEMFEAMAEMEAICGRLAARRMNERELQALKAAHNACSDAATTDDPDVYYAVNATFHEVIYDGCHNVFFAEELRRLRQRLQIYRRLQLRVRNRIKSSLDEHGTIVKAIEEGDGDKAAKALFAHVTIQGERFTQLLAELKQA